MALPQKKIFYKNNKHQTTGKKDRLAGINHQLWTKKTPKSSFFLQRLRK
jgi:hypothetical protein